MILYRGDTSRPKAPELIAGTWLTPDAEVAAWYGCAHRYDVPDMRALDLTSLGVGDGEDGAQVEALHTTLSEAGIDVAGLRLSEAEIYLLVERADFQARARAAGYQAIACMQWHADRSSEPYEAVLLI